MSVVGEWRSTEAFGNTSLDWSQKIKARISDVGIATGLTFKQENKAVLYLGFTAEGEYTFKVRSNDPEHSPRDLTETFRHTIPSSGRYSFLDNQVIIEGERTGLNWFVTIEEGRVLRLRYGMVIEKYILDIICVPTVALLGPVDLGVAKALTLYT